ncbi:hypothetical protein [Vreelandella jeotgali]|uniref:hypothetical protein n=1 Tax=Vreelandella jeotgali TaxID=553386 RepID=UPI00034DD520|nr:hypothetical protein [Halomonas jeotgali]
MLSVIFHLDIILAAADGTHRRLPSTDHRVCRRDQLDDSHYLDVVAHSLFTQFRYTHHKVVRVVINRAVLPGNETKDIHYIADCRESQQGDAA